jgi:23S rRNA (uracil1939-C5)-methyltransferase
MKLQIEKAVYGGSGLAHQGEGAGKAVFVPFVLPGELVEATLTEEKDGFDEAVLVQVDQASRDRVTPGCAHFGECGGCHYQHATYEAQVAMKTAILRETLERAGLQNLPEIKAHIAAPWEYRNRVRMRMAEVDGALRFGYNQRGTNRFLPIQECPIAAPLLLRAAKAVLQVAAGKTVAARWIRGAAEIEFFARGDETKLQMTIFVRSLQTAGFEEFCEHIAELIPELVGAGASHLPAAKQGRQVERPQPLRSWRADGLNYAAAGQEYWVSRGGFFQVNRFLVGALASIVTDGRQGVLAWDLYAGVGLFSRVLTKRFAQIVAVEAAGDDLVRSFIGPGRRAVSATVVQFLQGAVVQRERPGLVVMDPPRAGVGAEVCALLARVSAPEMVYVSCDPVTLARDLKSLTAAGYKITELHMIDLFPQTFHLETVVVLRK